MPDITPESSEGIEAVQFEAQASETFPPPATGYARLYAANDKWLESNSGDDNASLRLPQPGARAGRTSMQSIAPSTPTILPFNYERWDTDGMYSTSVTPSRITCTRAGHYLIMAQVAWESTSTFERVIVVVLNGTTVIAYCRKRAAGFAGGLAMTVYALQPGDYVEVQVTQDTAVSRSVIPQPYSPEFTVTRIG